MSSVRISESLSELHKHTSRNYASESYQFLYLELLLYRIIRLEIFKSKPDQPKRAELDMAIETISSWSTNMRERASVIPHGKWEIE